MRIKKYILIFLVFLINIFILDLNVETLAYDNFGSIASESAILINTENNNVIYDKNMNKKMSPASTTKILTALVTIENTILTEKVTASENAVLSIPAGYVSANIKIGETFTVEQLLQMLLVHSANDAANVLAEHVGGSIPSFISMMNTKVSDLGLTDSNFTNTYGLEENNHYTTSYDLAQIMYNGLKNDTFRKYMSLASCAIPETNMSGTRAYSNTNELIVPNSPYYYDYATSGKTGFTTQAGNCLVSAAFKNDVELICVVLGGYSTSSQNLSTRFKDSKRLYDYAFDNFCYRNLTEINKVITTVNVTDSSGKNIPVDLVADKSITTYISNNDFKKIIPIIDVNSNISAPISTSDVLGTITFKINNTEYSANLISSKDVYSNLSLMYTLAMIFGFIFLLGIIKIIIHKIRIKN